MKEQFKETPELNANIETKESRFGENHDKLGERVSLLLNCVRRHEHFSSDIGDEFQITRENGHQQGIFKVWAPPVIPELEGIAAKDWSKNLREKPLALFESLEQWRSFSDIADRRLQLIFENRPLPAEPEQAMVELFMRLNFAFALASPFYNLEALVADSREVKTDNPIVFDQQGKGDGKLDLAAMMLPSALENILIADRSNWNNVSWDLLKSQVETMKQSFLSGTGDMASQQFRLIAQVAGVAGVKLEEVLFATNALQFIPVSVGGKKGDLEQDESLAMLTQLFETTQANVSTSAVAQELNALIRFLNWTTPIQSSQNFQGKFWRYDAVCATAGSLLKLIKKNLDVAFDQEFSSTFLNFLSLQLDNLDATSAKGRFLMQLLFEGKFRPSIAERIVTDIDSFNNEVDARLEEIKRSEMFVDLGQSLSPFLVGGKAVGIARAMQIFSERVVHEGKVISTEIVESWLEQIEGMKLLITDLNSGASIDEKILIGQDLAQLVSNSEIPQELLKELITLFGGLHRIVLRSSSFDEDVDIIGPAPGIYESAIDIDPNNIDELQKALKIVMSSFFSEKAIGFREMKGLRHIPLMAIIVQEFVDAPGGSVFVDKDRIDLNIVTSPSQINRVGSHFEKHKLVNSKANSAIESNLLTVQQTSEIIWIAQKVEKLFGPSDIEFVIDPQTQRIKILQMRSLKKQAVLDENGEAIQARTTILIDDLEFLPALEGDLINIKIDDDIDLEKFQGQLFRWIITNNNKIVEITLGKKIPLTCHFANIVGCLGIKLMFAN